MPFYHKDTDQADFLNAFLDAKIPTDFMLALYVYSYEVLFLCYPITSGLHKVWIIIAIILIARHRFGGGPGQNDKLPAEFQGAKEWCWMGIQEQSLSSTWTDSMLYVWITICNFKIRSHKEEMERWYVCDLWYAFWNFT